jgi:hypothetical protein
MSDFPEECKGCPFETGDFILTHENIETFKCQCNELSNCSYYETAYDFVEDKE